MSLAQTNCPRYTEQVYVEPTGYYEKCFRRNSSNSRYDEVAHAGEYLTHAELRP